MINAFSMPFMWLAGLRRLSCRCTVLVKTNLAAWAGVKYDTYYNIDNGARIDTHTKNYWGITRIGISLVYRFNLQK